MCISLGMFMDEESSKTALSYSFFVDTVSERVDSTPWSFLKLNFVAVLYCISISCKCTEEQRIYCSFSHSMKSVTTSALWMCVNVQSHRHSPWHCCAPQGCPQTSSHWGADCTSHSAGTVCTREEKWVNKIHYWVFELLKVTVESDRADPRDGGLS